VRKKIVSESVAEDNGKEELFAYGANVIENDVKDEEVPSPKTAKPAPEPEPWSDAPEPSGRESLIPGIDLDAIALDDDYADEMDDGGSLVGLPVTKPRRDWFFRAHPTLFKNVKLLNVKDGPDRGYYIVMPAVWPLFRMQGNDHVALFPCRLTLCISRECGLFLWPLKLQEKNFANRIDEWAQAALRICKAAETQWVKMYTRPGANCYSYVSAEGLKVEPKWPEQSLGELAELAFKDRILSDPNDPLILRLLGKA
jgi:hypothetical protein